MIVLKQLHHIRVNIKTNYCVVSIKVPSVCKSIINPTFGLSPWQHERQIYHFLRGGPLNNQLQPNSRCEAILS